MRVDVLPRDARRLLMSGFSAFAGPLPIAASRIAIKARPIAGGLPIRRTTPASAFVEGDKPRNIIPAFLCRRPAASLQSLGGNIRAAGGMRHAFTPVRRLCRSEACCGSHAIDHEIEFQDGKEMFFIWI